MYLEINIQSCECQKSRTLSYIYCSTIKEGISHFGLILSTPSFVSLLFFLAGTLRSLPVQVRLLLVLAAARDRLQRGGGNSSKGRGISENKDVWHVWETPSRFALGRAQDAKRIKTSLQPDLCGYQAKQCGLCEKGNADQF